MEETMNQKWSELLDFARQHATGEGLRTGRRWLEDSFNEYLNMSDSTPGYGMGGQPDSMHNREVLAEKVCLELGYHVGGRHLIDADQEAKLRQTLNDIVADQSRTNGLKL